jgi:hypothetical protein
MKASFFIGLLLLSSAACAQWGDSEMDQKAPWQERIFTGGGLGLSFGTDVDFISISPIIGYRLTPKLASGLSLTYRYTNYKYVTPKIATNDFGAAPFLRFNFYKNFFLHAEYEFLNYEFPISASESERRSFKSFMAGGGFFQPLGRNAGFFAIALYNFSYRNPTSSSTYQPYGSPLVLRAGITAGF